MDVKKRSLLSELWLKITGHPSDFSMENRAFNYISFISFAILFYCLIFDWYIGQYVMSVAIGIILLELAVLFYFSRIKKLFQIGIILYAIQSYLVLILNYFYNSGVNGPTICIFFLTFHLLIAIGKPKHFPFWIFFHSCIVLGLLFMEFRHPEMVPENYRSRTDRFLDMGINYIGAIIFIFAITDFLRKSYIKERLLAEKRATAILAQNEHILLQNKQLEQLNEEKNKLFSIVSHDLKSPIDSLTGYLEILSYQVLNEQDKKEFELQLLEKTRYASDMLSNLLAWAKTQMNGVKVNLTETDLKAIIDEAVNTKISAAEKKQLTLNNINQNSIWAICDFEMTRIVMRNLINNSIKFTPEKGVISVSAMKEGNEVIISVKDNGIGIPFEKQPNIFSLKTNSSYGTNNEKGMGLGLLMCKEFMDYQKGRIWFESTPGVGSTFYIAFPSALH
jgi:signal transduction histidine kinase